MFLTVTFSKALGMSVVGFAIVFAALILLMFLIKLISAFAIFIEDKRKKNAPVPVVPSETSDFGVPHGMVPANGSYGEIKLNDVDEKSAALIMAIVADELKAPLNELRFISIRTKQEDK